jgi:hypothetical protein
MTAKEILSLLENKHKEDVFIPECKNGSTWLTNHRRLDAWVMPKSWTNLKFIGYEIKVSRSDFLNDKKFQEYYKMCNEFYFVTPKGLCKDNELPNEAGLLEVSLTGSRLFTRKKAPYRKIDFPEDLFVYILMCRAKITKEINFESNLDYWEKWLEEKENKSIIGEAVSKKLRQNYNKKIYDVENKQKELENRLNKYDEFKKLLENVGITDNDSVWSAKDKINNLNVNKYINDIEYSLNRLKENIEKSLNDFSKLKNDNLTQR